jgi:hypothetical protein
MIDPTNRPSNSALAKLVGNEYWSLPNLSLNRTPTGGASRLGGRRLPWFVRHLVTCNVIGYTMGCDPKLQAQGAREVL